MFGAYAASASPPAITRTSAARVASGQRRANAMSRPMRMRSTGQRLAIAIQEIPEIKP
jgi:hypothetical protein